MSAFDAHRVMDGLSSRYPDDGVHIERWASLPAVSRTPTFRAPDLTPFVPDLGLEDWQRKSITEHLTAMHEAQEKYLIEVFGTIENAREHIHEYTLVEQSGFLPQTSRSGFHYQFVARFRLYLKGTEPDTLPPLS